MGGLHGQSGLWLIVLAPLAGACVAGALAIARKGERLAPLITLAGAAAAGLSALMNRPSRSAGYLGDTDLTWLTIGNGFRISLGVHLDHLAWVLVGVVIAVSFLVQLYSIGYMRGENGFARYFAYLSLFTASMLGLVVADNLVQLYACWELVGICSYLLIGFWWHKPSAAAASKKAFVVTRFGDVGFLLGVILLATAAGSFDLERVRSMFQSLGTVSQQVSPLVSNEALLWLAPILLLCGAVGKSAQFPLHIWLPDAMEGPTPVSALIHAATMVAAGVYMVARLMWMFAGGGDAESATVQTVASFGLTPLAVVLLVGSITAFIGATIALVQTDIKKVLAYSTISQLGFMMMALGAGGEAGQSTAIFHLVTHAFFKALLFLTAGSVIHALHHAADPNDMRLMGGLWRRMPITTATCGIGVLALAGFPPFAGFWSKDAIIGLLLHRSGAQLLGVSGQVTPGHGPEPWAAAIGATVAVVVTLLTALYAVRLWLMVFAGAARSHDADSARESSVWMTLPLVILAVPSVLVGGWLHHGNLLHGYLTAHMAHELEMHLPVAAVATVLGLAGAAAAWSLYGRRPVAAGSGSVPSDPITRMPAPIYALLVNLWYVDRFWTWVGRSFAMAVATLIAWFDRNVVDGAVRGSGRVVAAIGSAMARSTNGQPQTYAAMVLAATVALILLMALYETAAAPAAGATAVRLAEWAVRR